MDKSIQGKKNRKSGKRFEEKVRDDLETHGWIVARWLNSVSDFPEENINKPSEERIDRKIVPARTHMFMGRIVNYFTGFPDFIAFKKSDNIGIELYHIVGFECKVSKYLSKEEKDMCNWLIDNKIFSKIFIASKGKKRGEINYEEFGSN